MPFSHLRVALIVPCYNEELTISSVIDEFKAVLPSISVFVFDNNSTDRTSWVAKMHGAIVHSVRLQGKGNVVRRMFADIEADIYLMADGDGTYSPADAHHLITELVDKRADMVVGTRRGVHDDAGRHARGDGDVDAPVHALHDGDGSGVLGKVTLPRQPGVRAAEGFAVPAGEFEQPGDALGDGPVGNRVHVSSICSTGRVARWRVVSPFNARRRCLPRHRNQIPCSYNKLRIHSFLH